MSQQSPATELAKNVFRLSRLINEFMQHQMEQEGLYDVQPSSSAVLLPLAEEEGQTLSKLARMLNMKAPTVTVIANRLQEKGWIRRDRSSDDRRKVHLYLTESGRAVAEILIKIRKRILQQMVVGLEREHMNTVNEIIMKMYTNIETKMP